MPRFKWRHQYDDEVDEAIGNATAFINTEPGLTQQQFTDEVNLNVMVARMGVRDGAIPPAVLDERYYGDFSDAEDFRTSLDRIRDAEERFAALPAAIRKKFENDPTKLFAWVIDPKNEEDAVKLGLLKAVPALPPKPEPAKPADSPKPT